MIPVYIGVENGKTQNRERGSSNNSLKKNILKNVKKRINCLIKDVT